MATTHIDTIKSSGLFPLSSTQSRIWFMENFDRNITAYNIPLDYKITGDLDIGLLTHSINELIVRHESLRTIFPKVNGLPVQKVLPELQARIQVVHLENEASENHSKEISGHSLANANYKFDIEKGPLFRFELLILGNCQFVFLVNFHNLISDPLSVGVFFEELTSFYQSISEHKPSGLPQLTISYRDYTLWQKRWLEGEECRKQMEYWKKELSGIPEALQLRTDFRRPKIQTFNGAEYYFDIDEVLREKLVLVSRRHGTDLSSTLLAAFGSLLSRYSSQEDLVIGVPASGRNNYELGSLIGDLINILPIRFTMKGDMTFSEAVEFTKKKFLLAYENQEVPFERLVEELKIKRALDKSPVFQVLFSFLTDYRKDIRFPGLTLEVIKGERNSAQYDLSLSVNDQKSNLSCFLEYNTDLFRKETMERFAEHWITLLHGLCSAENRAIDEISFVTEKEKEEMFVTWNRTEAVYPKDQCIHQVFEDQVKRTPDSIAVEFENEQLTYSELNSRAGRLAGYLAGQGAREGKIVAVFMERSIDLVAALLAVSKTGATYLPLDPIYPKARREMIQDDAKPLLVLTQSSLLEKLPASTSGVILADDKNLFTGEDNFSARPGNPESPAYVLYTSGSTGKPKGVAIKQRSVINLINSFSRLLKVKPEDTLLAVTTISFDIAELELFLPLFNGAKLVIAPQETAMNAELLIEKLEACNATIFQATPVTFRMLVSSSWKGKTGLKVLCGGEAFPKELARELTARCAETWNVYGPTETTIWSVAKKVEPPDTEGDGYVPIGRPLDNTTLYVLNKKGIPVPAGLPGELYIGGDGVSPGYLNLPEITAERFIPDIFSNDPVSKLYRTGDLVKYLPDGNLVFLERNDSQVKIRGFRIELGEIESILSQFGGIKENVVITRDDASGEKILAAYFIPEEKQTIDNKDLRKFLNERVPDYMVPSFFIKMDKFPLTSSLKVDRKALPEPMTGEARVSREHVAPVTPTEKKLAEIWMSLLKLKKVSIHDDFFEVGGYSIIAVTMMTRIEKEFGVRLPLASLFEHSTISNIAHLIDEGSQSLKWRPLVPIKPAGSRKPLFLVHGMGLNVLLYTTVVRYMDPEVPVYGLQAKGMNGKEEPLKTIEEIAAYYISEIMTVDQEGPYAMAGYSLGGRIAYEMARQLNAMGKEVRFVGLFDTSVDEPTAHLPFIPRNKKRLRHNLRYLGWNVLHFFRENEESKLSLIRRRIKGLQKRITGLDFKIDKEELVSTGAMSELPRYLKKVHRANRRAERNYIVKPYNGKIHVFKARKQTFYISDPVNLGWDKYALGGVILHETPGEHSTTFAPPNDRIFASVLQDSLDKCES